MPQIQIQINWLLWYPVSLFHWNGDGVGYKGPQWVSKIKSDFTVCNLNVFVLYKQHEWTS